MDPNDGGGAPIVFKHHVLPQVHFATGNVVTFIESVAIDAVLEELASLDVDGLTPLQAITKLYELQEKA